MTMSACFMGVPAFGDIRTTSSRAQDSGATGPSDSHPSKTDNDLATVGEVSRAAATLRQRPLARRQGAAPGALEVGLASAHPAARLGGQQGLAAQMRALERGGIA